MKIDILTLFPEAVDAFLNSSIIGRGRRSGLLDIKCSNIRDWADDARGTTDDYPYGGGMGMLMMCEPLYRCLSEVSRGRKPWVVLTSPRGKTFSQEDAKRLLDKKDVVFVCGHYEGIDQRFIDECVDEELSIGDYVLTGGEIAAIVMTDAVCRMVPGVLAESESFEQESHFNGLLEYPQYTRPEVWHGKKVPQVLLGGDHEKIADWRRQQALGITRERRPDMFDRLELSWKDKELLGEDVRSFRGTRRLQSGDIVLRRFDKGESFSAGEELYRSLPLAIADELADMPEPESAYKDPLYFRWAVEKDGRIAGVCGFYEVDAAEKTASAFIAADGEDETGVLYSQILELLLLFAFKRSGFRRITVYAPEGDGHTASAAEENRMVKEGTARELFTSARGKESPAVYAMTAGRYFNK